MRALLAEAETPTGGASGVSPDNGSCCGSSAGSPVRSGAGFGMGSGAVGGHRRRRSAAQSLTFAPPSLVTTAGEEQVRLAR